MPQSSIHHPLTTLLWWIQPFPGGRKRRTRIPFLPALRSPTHACSNRKAWPPSKLLQPDTGNWRPFHISSLK